MSGMFGGGGTNPYDEIVAKTTDENLTTENWELILNLCDKVQDEGSDGARLVLSSLLKRLSHRNPNVQLYTLSLADALSKNCGLIINREIASRAFTSGLEKLVTDRNAHDKVKKRVLGLIKEWTEEWEGQDELGIMEECYLDLKKKNFNFDAITEPPPPAVDDEIRRREEEELQRVLEMSMQDRGGYSSSSWTQSNAASSSGSQSNHSGTAIAPQNGYVPAANPTAATSYAPSSAPTASSTSSEPARSTARITSSLGSMTIGSTTSLDSTSSLTRRSNRVRALHPFTPTEPGELAFNAGDIITVVDRNYKDWWRGQLRGRTGIFPVNYVEILPPPDEAELAREAQQEAAVFAEATNVERLLEMLRDLDRQQQEYTNANSRAQATPPSRLADNDELQELYRSCMALRPKIVKLIEKYSQKRADLVSMNETFVRARGIFERLMEESLAGYGGGGGYPPNMYGGRYSVPGIASPSSYVGPQPGYFPTPTPGPYPGAYRGPVQAPVQGPVQAPTVGSPAPQGIPAGVGPGIQGQILQGQQQSVSAYEALYGQRASQQQQTGRYPSQGQEIPGGQGPTQQTYPHQSGIPVQSPQAQNPSQQQPQQQPAVQQVNMQAIPSTHQPQQQPQQQPPQAQSPVHSQTTISTSGPPPYPYSPTATYSDSNVEAWAQYYAQGGKDPTGAVYFISVPGVKEPSEGNQNEEQRMNDQSSERQPEQGAQVQVQQTQPIQQTSPVAQPQTQTQIPPSSYGSSPYQSLGVGANADSSSSLPLPYPGSNSGHEQLSRSSTVDSTLSTATGGSLPNPYGVQAITGNAGGNPGVPGNLERSSSLPYPGDSVSNPPAMDQIQNPVGIPGDPAGPISPSSPHASSYPQPYPNSTPSTYSSAGPSTSFPLGQQSLSSSSLPAGSGTVVHSSSSLSDPSLNTVVSGSPQISTSTPSWVLPKMGMGMGQGHFGNPNHTAGTRVD
ncbi:hypothetical protein EV361DRAFT_616738 [Lentinula raphanica]|nr:hypothetical protein EV361DRAFT_616738 [Lentinula raphanica]